MRDLDCRELVELVTAYLDGSLDDDLRGRFAAHLDVCPGCREYVDQFRVTIAELGNLSVADLAPETRRALLEAFRTLPRG